MNDRFKFRHYNKLAKSFTYYENPELQVDLNREFKSGLIFPLAEEQGLYMGEYSELQQCTGLKDKNGKLIYEGDICRHSKTGKVFVVAWHGTYASFTWKEHKHSYLYDYWALFRASDYYEVIGNIYENKELLEVEDV